MDTIERHGRALTGFTAVVDQVTDDGWSRPTPCAEWDARALVEHVIGFHEFLLLRPLGLRAHRPRTMPAARWHATEHALRRAHADPVRLEEPAETFDGAARRPSDVLDALATDTLIHSWDLARAVGAPDRLDRALCERAYDEVSSAAAGWAESGLYAPPVLVAPDADLQDRLLGLTGRDPGWRPSGG